MAGTISAVATNPPCMVSCHCNNQQPLLTVSPCAICSEDVATADGLDAAAKEQLYTDLASGAESGWDYSSRWLADGTNLSTIRTTQVWCTW